MNNSQNEFYSSIAKYYSEIFPYKPVQLEFVKHRTGELKGQQILDIGCATGELAFQLANEGADVSGIDINRELLAHTEKKKHDNLYFQIGDMLELNQDFRENQFDAVLCFGNTLVHLPDTNSIDAMLEGVHGILKPGGKFLLQILNYDHILNEQVSELPVIETENISFVRNYQFEENSYRIKFQTELHLKKEEEVISNETLLLALRSSDLVDLLKQAGFNGIELYANFNMDEFGGKHLPLVVSCTK